mgnify:CR=1 FL=1
MHHAVAKLTIDRLIIIPFTIHPVLQTPLGKRLRNSDRVPVCSSYGDIVNYNTRSRASFFNFFSPDFMRVGNGTFTPPLSLRKGRVDPTRAYVVYFSQTAWSLRRLAARLPLASEREEDEGEGFERVCTSIRRSNSVSEWAPVSFCQGLTR